MDAVRERRRERAKKLVQEAIEAGATPRPGIRDGFDFQPQRRPTTEEARRLATICALAADHGRRTGELSFHVNRQGEPCGLHVIDPKITPAQARRKEGE